MIKQLFLILIILISLDAQAQDPTYITIGEKEFSNTDVYTVFMDELTGLIYTGTNNGLYVYKKGEFVKLSEPGNQIGSSYFDLQEDRLGNLYCKNLKGQVFRINKDSTSFEVFYEIKSDLKKGGTYWYCFDLNNNFVIASRLFLKIVNFQKNTEQTIINLKDSTSISEGYAKIRDLKQTSNGVIFMTANVLGGKVYSLSNSGLIHLTAKDKVNNNAWIDGNIYLFNNDNNLFSIHPNGDLGSYSSQKERAFTYVFNERIFQLTDSTIVGMHPHSGYRILKINKTNITETQMLFPKLFVSAIHRTKSGIHILGTFGEGLRIVPNSNVKKKEFDYLFLGIVSLPNNEVFITTRSGEILKVTNTYDLKTIKKTKSNIDDVWYISDYKTDEKIINRLIFSGVRDNDNRSLVGLKDIVTVNDSVMVFTKSSGVTYMIKDEGWYFQRAQFLISEKCTNIAYLKNTNTLYIATNLGLFNAKLYGEVATPVLFNEKSIVVKDLSSYENTVYCATNSKGVLILGNDIFIQQLSMTNGLLANNVKQVQRINNLLFILTNKGLQAYNISENKLINIGVKNGVINRDITKFSLSKDKIWLLEKHSFYALPLSLFSSTETVESVKDKIYITDVSIGGEQIDCLIDNEFQHTTNNFIFNFDYKDILIKDEIQVYYSIDKNNENWNQIPTNSYQVKFDYLPSGNYTFKLKAKYKESEDVIFKYNFKVLKPIWARLWFILTSIVLLLSVVFFITILRIRITSKKNAQKLKIEHIKRNEIDAQLKAIRAQMNPHFIFNAINSIQDLVLQKDTLQSYDYLVLFSRLVRNTLDYSEKGFITIEQELDYLNVYLDLEKLRLQHSFTYTITSSVGKGLKIPALIIQPFIENAIKHGLLHKKGDQKLSINFSYKDDYLMCTIVDNGVGRKRSRFIQKRQQMGHKSFSTNAIKKRLAILEEQLNQKCYYKTFDLEDDKNFPIGTKVIVYLPVKKIMLPII